MGYLRSNPLLMGNTPLEPSIWHWRPYRPQNSESNVPPKISKLELSDRNPEPSLLDPKPCRTKKRAKSIGEAPKEKKKQNNCSKNHEPYVLDKQQRTLLNKPSALNPELSSPKTKEPAEKTALEELNSKLPNEAIISRASSATWAPACKGSKSLGSREFGVSG